MSGAEATDKGAVPLPIKDYVLDNVEILTNEVAPDDATAE